MICNNFVDKNDKYNYNKLMEFEQFKDFKN